MLEYGHFRPFDVELENGDAARKCRNERGQVNLVD